MKRDIERREKTKGYQCRDNRDGEEREEVDEILFCLDTRVNRDTVKPPPT